ncbi:aldo/keto reductase [bacterium]|nr:aldo/keto reductase [bacterium]
MPIPTIKFNNGNYIPELGLGLWKIKNEEEFKNTVNTALNSGYRHFDTAQVYDNEKLLGEVLKKSDIKREDLFITTKIWLKNFGFNHVAKSFDKSLENLQTDYADLLLLHFPVTGLRRKAWQALENIQAEGKALNIGVSNYMIHHLEDMKKYAKITPQINQVEMHVFLQQPDLVRYCQDNGIVVEAYSPIAHGKEMDDPVIKKIAIKHNKTYAQIMIRWCIEKGFVVIPKSSTPSRVIQNIDVFDFELDKDDLVEIKKLDKNLRTCWSPVHIP